MLGGKGVQLVNINPAVASQPLTLVRSITEFGMGTIAFTTKIAGTWPSDLTLISGIRSLKWCDMVLGHPNATVS